MSETHAGVGGSGGTSPEVLWIDDQPEQADLLRLLSLEGFRVTPAMTGTAGLTLASAGHFDAIVVDLYLPDLHGFTVIERLRARGISVPVVAVTGHYLDPEVPRHAREAGATAFHSRPLSPEETARLLRAVLASPPCSGTRHVVTPPGRRLGADGSSEGDRNDDATVSPIAVLLRRLDRLELRVHDDSDDCSREVLLRVLLSALAEPALPLNAVRECSRALYATLTLPALTTVQLITNARDLARQVDGRPLTARHPVTRKALDVLHRKPRWWDEEDLATEVATSRCHFARMVRRDTGLPFRTLRRIVVMKAAILDVLNTDEQFAQIAFRLSMHPATFDAIFREVFGCCPRELRRLWWRLRS